MHLSLVHSSIYSSYAQNNIVPAQYFRNYADEAELAKYLNGTSFLRDINNERVTDLPADVASLYEDGEARNETYKDNLKRLNKLVLLRFS
jgi:palmitoyl-protein thioesterase